MLDHEIISKLYQDGYSIREICRQVDSYPSRIYKILRETGTEMRSKSEVQKNALESGKAKHPTKGRKREHSTKIKISKALEDQWRDLAYREHMSKKAKKIWDQKTEEEKAAFHSAGHAKVRAAADEGSRIEKYFAKALREEGYHVISHKKKFLPNVQLECDLLIAALKVVIEIDGPSHQLPIWGQEAFERRQKADADKNGSLLNAGYVVIRVKFNSSDLSLNKREELKKEVMQILEDVDEEFPPKHKRYYEVIA